MGSSLLLVWRARARRVASWASVVAVAAAWAGCSAQAPAGRKAAGVEVGGAVEARDREEVSALYDAISRDMVAVRGGAYRPPSVDDSAPSAVPPGVVSPDAVVPEPGDEPSKQPTAPQAPGTTPRCVQVASAICTSSSRICDIATRHPSEPYFTDKCLVATAACQDASAICTSYDAEDGATDTNARAPKPAAPN